MNYGEYTALLTDVRNELAYVADIDTHEMLFMTRAAMKLAGLASAEEYKGKKCYEILHNMDEPCSFCTNRYLLEGQSPYTWEQYNQKAQKWLRLTNYLFHLNGRRCRGEWATDISSDHDAISGLQNQHSMDIILMKGIRTLAFEPDVHRAVNLFLQYIGEYYQADRTCIFEVDYDRNTVSNTFEWCADSVVGQMADFQDRPLEHVQDWLDTLKDAPHLHIYSVPEPNEAGIEEVLTSRAVMALMVVPLKRNGEIIGFLGADNPKVFYDDSTLLRLIADFITEEFQKRELVSDLESDKLIDRLTGLKNRRNYVQTLEKYRKQPPESLGVLCIDLNGVKDLNEYHGHHVGDLFICDCADILRSMNLNAYRTGGDEFVALQPDISQEAFQKEEEALRKRLGHLQPRTVSVGAAYGAGEIDVAALIRQADEFMYAEKQLYYRGALTGNGDLRTGLAADIFEDIQNERFILYFQPQIDLKTGRLYGAEALVRKRDDDGSIIAPGQFIPFYEAEGIVSHMDFHVLEQVCAAVHKWRDSFGECPHISVNFSRMTLMETDVISRIVNVCRKFDIPPSCLTIEVTESTGKLTQEQLYDLIGGLQKEGFAVSLDDFGSRYSNLSILAHIDFQLVKLDKSLVDQIGMEKKSTMFVGDIIRLCRDTLHTHSLAEGIETGEQAKILRGFGCDYAQGYYYSRPMPADDFTDLLRDKKVFTV